MGAVVVSRPLRSEPIPHSKPVQDQWCPATTTAIFANASVPLASFGLSTRASILKLSPEQDSKSVFGHPRDLCGIEMPKAEATSSRRAACQQTKKSFADQFLPSIRYHRLPTSLLAIICSMSSPTKRRAFRRIRTNGLERGAASVRTTSAKVSTTVPMAYSQILANMVI